MAYRWLLNRWLALLIAMLCTVTVTAAADPVSALDLVSNDAAFCIEIPNLEETWGKLEPSQLMQRLRAFPPNQHILESNGYERWREIEKCVADHTGQNLSEQLRQLFAKSLVLAMYVPADGPPRGILIGEAATPEAVKTAFDTWNQLEPNSIVEKKALNGHRYIKRKKGLNDSDSLYFASHQRWFAISDHESLIHDVIERFLASIGKTPPNILSSSLRRSNVFARNRSRLKRNAAAYVHIGARAWDRSLDELSATDKSPVTAASVWRHVNTIAASLHFNQGIVCDAVIELEKSNLPQGWSQLVQTGSGAATWNQRVPPEAILACAGRLELVPLSRLVLNQILPLDQTEFSQCRRTVRNLLNGQDPFDDVLPALARNFCGYFATATDTETKQISLEGMLGFTLESPDDAKLLQNVNDRLESAVRLLGAYFNTATPEVVVVNREKTDSSNICWATESSTIPVALGTKGQNLVIAASQERVQRSFSTEGANFGATRLSDHSQRYFPYANQLLWFDTAQTRKLLNANTVQVAKLFGPRTEEDAKRLAGNLEQILPTLELVDSLFLAARFEQDHVRLTFGGGLDEK